MAWAEAARQQDNGPLDRDPRPDRVVLDKVRLSVGSDFVLSGRASFDSEGPVDLKLFGVHQVGLGGRTSVSLQREGQEERLRVRQDGYRGYGAFTADLSHTRGSGEFLNGEVKEGIPQGWDAVKEVFTDPAQLALISGCSLGLAGFVRVLGLPTIPAAIAGAISAVTLGWGAIATTENPRV
jgi:hypothetical protein